MKALSQGFVFDTETATLVAKHENAEHGNCYMYLTKFGRYFAHYVPTAQAKEEGDTEKISYLEGGAEDLDDLIEELNETFEEQVEVFLEHFQVG